MLTDLSVEPPAVYLVSLSLDPHKVPDPTADVLLRRVYLDSDVYAYRWEEMPHVTKCTGYSRLTLMYIMLTHRVPTRDVLESLLRSGAPDGRVSVQASTRELEYLRYLQDVFNAEQAIRG